MDAILDRYAAELAELDGLEALPDRLWAQACTMATNRPELPLSTVTHSISSLDRFLGEGSDPAATARALGLQLRPDSRF